MTPAPAGGPARGPAASAGGEPAGTGPRSGVTGGALFGGDSLLVPEAAKLGRKLAIVRMYFSLGEQFPIPGAQAAMRAGSTVLASLDANARHRPGFYAAVIAGRDDAAIKRFLQEMEQAAVSHHLGAIYFSFQHEPNTPRSRVLGSTAQFVQAWDHVHRLASSAHLLWNQGGRLHFVLILSHMAYFSMRTRPRWADSEGQASSYFPGKNEVDIVSADGYNTSGCRNARPGHGVGHRRSLRLTPAQLFDPLVSFARAHGGLPVFIAEWASVAFASATEQPTFINQMKSYVPANREIAAAMYWDSRSPTHALCNMRVDSHPVSLSALASMGRSTALQGHLMSRPAR